MLKKIKSAGHALAQRVKNRVKLAAARHVLKRAEPGSDVHDRAADAIFNSALAARSLAKKTALVREYGLHHDQRLIAMGFAPAPKLPTHAPVATVQPSNQPR